MENAKNGYIVEIVEDEKPLRSAMHDALSREGFETLLASNGEEGLELALSKKPDLILLDVLMPVMDGLTMLERLRANEWGKNVHVIILSNSSDSSKVSKALANGSFEYLIKAEWKISDIVKKVKGHFKIE